MPPPQESALSAATGAGTVTVMVPPLPEAGMEFVSEATTPVRPIERTPDAFAATWKLAVARFPLGIGVAFNPNTKQFEPPQLRDLPADVAEEPASTDVRVTPAGRLKLHWTAVGAAPPAEEIDIGRETAEPASAEPDPKDRDTD